MERRNLPGQRWLNVALRGLHLVAVIVLGAALLGAPVQADSAVHGLWLTGLAMLALDTWRKPSHLCEASGVALMVKLVLVGWMAVDAASRSVLFWIVVIGSGVFAHAPASFRHAVVIRIRRSPQNQ
ncbi:MAG TPA: hypothetical protein VMC81_07005 [Rhodocyclaceae bacterium]|nr:hypothetical protein [Rhodocyclaceae bacterium]